MSILAWIGLGWIVLVVISGIVVAILAWLAPVADEDCRHE